MSSSTRTPRESKPDESRSEEGRSAHLAGTPERLVSFRPRAVLIGLGVLVAVAAAVGFVVLAEAGLTLVAIALLLALALNPAVEFFLRRGLGRGAAVGAVYALALALIALLGHVLIPPLVTQITAF